MSYTEHLISIDVFCLILSQISFCLSLLNLKLILLLGYYQDLYINKNSCLSHLELNIKTEAN